MKNNNVKTHVGSEKQIRGEKGKVLFVTQYSLPEHKRNMNAYQRILYACEYADVGLIVRRRFHVSKELADRVTVYEAPFSGRKLFFLYSIALVVFLRGRGYRYILTEPSGFCGVGFVAKMIAGYFWVMDVWDRPRWRSGKHEDDDNPKLSDKFVFWIMKHANLYLLSVLPKAAKDILLYPQKCVQLHNAIDLSDAPNDPPPRCTDDPVLHVAYARSKFWETMGLEVLIKAAEILKMRECPVQIHLVGELTDSSARRIERSFAKEYFEVHGFIEESRLEFFRKVHVGLVPYPRFEDLLYIFPIKVLEHLRQGNPVVASCLPGLCSLVQHEFNGLIVDPGDPESLAAGIARLQADFGLWRRLAVNAIESVKRYDVKEKNKRIFRAIFEGRK